VRWRRERSTPQTEAELANVIEPEGVGGRACGAAELRRLQGVPREMSYWTGLEGGRGQPRRTVDKSYLHVQTQFTVARIS
jgi:hypothetical protein